MQVAIETQNYRPGPIVLCMYTHHTPIYKMGSEKFQLGTRSIVDLREMKTYLQCDFLKSLAFKSSSNSQLSKGYLSLVLSGRYIGGATWVIECHLSGQV